MTSDLQQLVASAELVHVGVTHSEFERLPDLPFQLNGIQKYTRQEILEAPARETEEDGDTEHLYCNIRCRVWVDPSAVGEDIDHEASYASAKLKISTVYLVAFRATGSSPLSDEAVWTFFERVGVLSVWPYFRSHCSHYANEAVIDLPTLPLKKAVYPVKEVGSMPLFNEVSDKPKSA